jgi:predicted PurR-regulated permease PerM
VESQQPDILRILTAVLVIALLCLGSLWILWPFLGSFIWAATIVLATWPIMRTIESRLWGRRSLAVAVMVITLLLLVFVPLSALITAVVANADQVASLAPKLLAWRVPELPASIAGLPLVGDQLAAFWKTVAMGGLGVLIAPLKPYAGEAVRWVAGQAGNLGMFSLHFLLTVAIAGVLYAGGEHAVRGVRGFARRISGARGDEILVLAGGAIRGVALGIVVTALVQSLLGGFALLITGVPFVGLLTAIMLMLCLAQLGPLLVLVPAVAWLYWSGDDVSGTVLLVCTVVVGSLDNFLRPWLIKKGADLPLLLILVGVIGGLIAFGLIGLFVGPVVLAVTYRLLEVWIGDAVPADVGR